MAAGTRATTTNYSCYYSMMLGSPNVTASAGVSAGFDPGPPMGMVAGKTEQTGTVPWFREKVAILEVVAIAIPTAAYSAILFPARPIGAVTPHC